MKSMVDPFVFKLVLSFIVGGTWTVLGTVIAEKFGTKAGGVIAGLPSAIVVALFFIGWTQSPRFASQATTLVPIVLGIMALFNVTYILLYRLSFYLAVVAGLGVWFTLSLGLVFLQFDSFPYSLMGFVLLLLFSYYVLEKRLHIRSESQKKVQYTSSQLSFRGLLGGGIIAFAVTMARIGGPLIGGVFATFPVVMLSTMIINHFNHGRSFATAFIKTMMVSGTVNTTIYATAVRFLYPSCGLIYGTFFSFVISLISGFFVYLFVHRRMS